MKKELLALVFITIFVSGCVSQQRVGITPELLGKKASAWPLTIDEARIFTENDSAFLSKLRLIEEAKKSIDLSYYIYADDHSSSVLTRALIAAARRGVPVRMIVDYQTNYIHLDLYSMMEREGNGNLQVRFYNRPTANIIKSAVFMTMGCGRDTAGSQAANCSADKFAAIDKLFAAEQINGVPAAGRNFSNLNIGNSGLFLSGLYAKRADAVAMAVQQGQGIDAQKFKGQGTTTTPEQKAQLKKLGFDYWQAKTGTPFAKLTANTELFFAFAMYGQQLNPLKDTLTGILPVDRTFSPEEARDWDHFTDYTHQKLLLVDRRELQMGGRNVENSYHMHPNPLISKYVFMDTDIYAKLNQGGEQVVQAFENIWNFTAMIATLAEVRQHAPNDFVANIKLAEEHCSAATEKSEREACVKNEMQTNAHDLTERMDDAKTKMDKNATIYLNDYLPSLASRAIDGFTVDKGSMLAYLENLPFNKEFPAEKRTRTYGAPVGEEAESGKYIHDIWLNAIAGICSIATRDNPKRIILHNAYFFPAANLTAELSQLVNGDHDCSNVTVTVLTNSIGTTDLNVVNLAARHVLKAFTEFYQQNSNPERRATFEYYEYQPPQSGPNMSLHSKVSIFGDDIIIGSANADVRSYMMDSNNAMFIRNAAEFQKSYLAFVRDILANQKRVGKLNDYFANTPRNVMLQEDLNTFRQILAKYGVDKKLGPEQQKEVEARFTRMLDDVYNLTRDSIASNLTRGKQRDNQNRFNEEFKPI